MDHNRAGPGSVFSPDARTVAARRRNGAAARILSEDLQRAAGASIHKDPLDRQGSTVTKNQMDILFQMQPGIDLHISLNHIPAVLQAGSIEHTVTVLQQEEVFPHLDQAVLIHIIDALPVLQINDHVMRRHVEHPA